MFYVSLLVFEMALLTLIMGVGLKWSHILTLYAGFERSCPRDSKNISYVVVGLI